MIVWFICGFALLVLFTLVIASTIRKKGRWGINPTRPNCPDCGTPAPIVRKPKSFGQMLWGGGTCPSCNCEMDKWGNKI